MKYLRITLFIFLKKKEDKSSDSSLPSFISCSNKFIRFLCLSYMKNPLNKSIHFFKFLKKQPSQTVSPPFARVIIISEIQHTIRLCVHLCCNFSCEVFILLLKTFSCLKTNKLLNCHVSSVLFSYLLYVFSYCKVAVLNIYLI